MLNEQVSASPGHGGLLPGTRVRQSERRRRAADTTAATPVQNHQRPVMDDDSAGARSGATCWLSTAPGASLETTGGGVIGAEATAGGIVFVGLSDGWAAA